MRGKHWMWTGNTQGRGERSYGKVAWNGKQALVHRVVYTLLVGDIPDGFDVDHECRRRLCVSPDCLVAKSHRANLLARPRRTHCVHGHKFDRVSKRGIQYCSTCARDRVRLHRMKKRSEQSS